MASAAIPTARRIPPPRIYATIHRRRSTTETKQQSIVPGDTDHDHEKCLSEENELRENNRRQLIRIELLERDYRQLDDDLVQLQNERDLLWKQKRILEEELDRSSHQASANADLHVYTQRLENECRDLRCQMAMCEKDKFEFNEIFADFEVQIKQARDRHEQWRETCTDLEALLATETESRQYLEVQLDEAARRQKENENQINRFKTELDEVIAVKQDIVKSNYILVQNAESLREQLRAARTQAAEVHMIRTSSNGLFDSLDESLPCLVFDENDDDTPVCEQIQQQSSLFSEINSMEIISDEIMTKYLDGTTNDIELDLLLAKTTTLSSARPLVNQLINEVKCLNDSFVEHSAIHANFEREQGRLSIMKTLLKRILENTQLFDTRFRKLQLLLIASREQRQCHQAELDDFFRLVDKRLVSNIEQSSDHSLNHRQRLISILEAYEHELDRLRQVIRTNDETIRSSERDLIEQKSTATHWRMKATFLDKNQRKLIDKIKELNSERRQFMESSTNKRTRRRALPVIQSEQQLAKVAQTQPSLPSPPRIEPIIRQRLLRSRSLPFFKSADNGRKSRNDSGVVLTDDVPHSQPISIVNARRRIKSNISSQFVLHTSNHVCFQTTINNSLSSNNSKYLSNNNIRRFQWFFLIFLLLILLLFSLTKFLL